MSIFTKFKTNKKTFIEKMETLEKWELDRYGNDGKLDLFSFSLPLTAEIIDVIPFSKVTDIHFKPFINVAYYLS